MDRDNKPKLLNRLNRIEGQVRGVARMVEDDRYCIDILTQLQAARAALAQVETETAEGPPGPLHRGRHRQRRQGRAARARPPN